MRPRVVIAFSVAIVSFVTVLSVWVYSATQNTVPKYDANFNLVDSAISEVGGNVGIGTSSPGRTLDVNGIVRTANSSGVLMKNSSGADDFQIYEDTSNRLRIYTNNGSIGDRLAITNDGFVGIDTANPVVPLHVNGGAGQSVRFNGNDTTTYNPANMLTGARVVRIANTNTSGSNAMLEFLTSTNGRSNFVSLGAADDGAQNHLVFGTGSPVAERMRIDFSGNVGIGTATPAAKLHVAGDVRVDGNIAAKYQDVAEWVDAAAPLDGGTVVVADPDRVNTVRASEHGYDTSVTGVVSERPGVLLGAHAPGKVAVAQSGRVRVKVDASFGAVHAGDLLVTSPHAGFAMRSQPLVVNGVPMHRPGTILGKALEPLPAGEGEILTLVTLQ